MLDNVAEKIGKRSRGGVPIRHVRELRRIVTRNRIKIAMVAVPASAAQLVANRVVSAGVRAILNFSPGTLRVPEGVKLKNADLTVSLESLSFFLARGNGAEEAGQ
jgi:redox-sensing transcriptional repressor